MAAIIAIITLSLIVAFLSWKLIPMAIELGKLRNEQESMVFPEVRHLRESNDRLNRDIEKIIDGDEYVIGVWRDIIKSRKNSKHLFEKFNFKN